MINRGLVNIVLTVEGIDIQVIRKDIKNLHLAVYPPVGQVRVAVPQHVTDDNVRLAVVSKLSWIKRQQKAFRDQPRQSERQYISGECHYFFGKRCRLEVIERVGKHKMVLKKSNRLQMFVNPNTSVPNKMKLLDDWYRGELKRCIPELMEKWQELINRDVAYCGIKKMKTKWGSCNIERRRIWLNLALAKKPPECLEYIFVHECIHLLERKHNERFKSLMDEFLPKWRTCRETLNKAPLAHQDWLY